MWAPKVGEAIPVSTQVHPFCMYSKAALFYTEMPSSVSKVYTYTYYVMVCPCVIVMYISELPWRSPCSVIKAACHFMKPTSVSSFCSVPPSLLSFCLLCLELVFPCWQYQVTLREIEQCLHEYT